MLAANTIFKIFSRQRIVKSMELIKNERTWGTTAIIIVSGTNLPPAANVRQSFIPRQSWLKLLCTLQIATLCTFVVGFFAHSVCWFCVVKLDNNLRLAVCLFDASTRANFSSIFLRFRCLIGRMTRILAYVSASARNVQQSLSSDLASENGSLDRGKKVTVFYWYPTVVFLLI